MMAKLLYGLDKGGKYKVWSIWTVGGELFIQHGKEGGKMQTKVEQIAGKNIGRANETSPAEQAELEAMSRWRKQVDKGYRETKEELTDLPLLPMLAQDYLKQGHRIQYPCYVMPKLDGVRCLAIRHEEYVELKSRGGKPYIVPHVQEALFRAMGVGDVWDGELYWHGACLEEITSAVKREEAREYALKCRLDYENAVGDRAIEKAYKEAENADLIHELRGKLEFHIFDVVNDKPYDERLAVLELIEENEHPDSVIQVVMWGVVKDELEMKTKHRLFVNLRYEGIMLRNKRGMYESGKRSADLQKYKEFFDMEFPVRYVREDANGNAMLGVYDALAEAEFETSYGDFDERKRQLREPHTVIGKALTVKFQTRYKDSRLPQFPTGLGFRDGVWVGESFVPAN